MAATRARVSSKTDYLPRLTTGLTEPEEGD